MNINFSCSHCNQSLAISSVVSGFIITCPKCKSRTKVPMNSPTKDTIFIDFRDVIEQRNERIDVDFGKDVNEKLEKITPKDYSSWSWQTYYNNKYCKSPLTPNVFNPFFSPFSHICDVEDP